MVDKEKILPRELFSLTETKEGQNYHAAAPNGLTGEGDNPQ